MSRRNAGRTPPIMFIPNSQLHDGRDVGQPYQLDVDDVASSGDGTSESSTDSPDAEQNTGPVDSTPGIHRFIGVISVAILILLVFSLWLARRKIRILLRRRSRSASAIQEGDKSTTVSGASENSTRIPMRNINNPRRTKRVAEGPSKPGNINLQPGGPQRQSNVGDAAVPRQDSEGY